MISSVLLAFIHERHCIGAEPVMECREADDSLWWSMAEEERLGLRVETLIQYLAPKWFGRFPWGLKSSLLGLQKGEIGHETWFLAQQLKYQWGYLRAYSRFSHKLQELIGMKGKWSFCTESAKKLCAIGGIEHGNDGDGNCYCFYVNHLQLGYRP